MLQVQTKMPQKKLLVLDVNGLLLDTYSCRGRRPDNSPDGKVGNFFVYKRPFCGDFIQFCLENFVVGVWSSARDYNVNSLVDFLFGERKQDLAFCWHQSDCTDVGLKSPDNKFKPLFLKELSKLWEKVKSDLPWDKGDYGPGNTLLVDDTPYKAILNPPNTGIFPQTYTVQNGEDDFLGGKLQKYLEGILDASNVQEYVKCHPLGEPSITSESPLWSYVEKVMKRINKMRVKIRDDIPRPNERCRETWHHKRKRDLSTSSQENVFPSEDVECYSRKELCRSGEDKIPLVQGNQEIYWPASRWHDNYNNAEHRLNEWSIDKSLPIPQPNLHNSSGRSMGNVPAWPWESVDANQMIFPSHQVAWPWNNWHEQSATYPADLEGDRNNRWRSSGPNWQVMDQRMVPWNMEGVIGNVIYPNGPLESVVGNQMRHPNHHVIHPLNWHKESATNLTYLGRDSWSSSGHNWQVINQGMVPMHLAAQPLNNWPEQSAANLNNIERNRDNSWSS